MCGIFGIYNLQRGRAFDEARFAAALARIRHRGPDAEKTLRFADKALFGHVRLSIIDLDAHSDQPMSILDRYTVVFNGEIFNYIELRRELQALGARFRTQGDTEVLLQAYARWGDECVRRFNGMWAFAIYDRLRNSLFCSRDRFGEKPFNYAVHDGQFLFASEIKAIVGYQPALAEPNHEAIANFCRTSVGAQHAGSWFKNVMRLPAGHNLHVHDGSIRLDRYWRYPSQPSQTVGYAEAAEQYRALFDDAVRLRMRSDVPLGLTLSSGVDSTAIACTMQRLDASPHHSFTAGFDPQAYQASELAPYADRGLKIDEAGIATRLAGELGLQAHVISTDYSDLVGSLDEVLKHLESGNSSPAVLPLMQVMRHARRHVKVLLEGQGADELLGGYIVSAIWPALLALLGQGRLGEAGTSMRQFLQGHALSYSLKMALRNLSNDVPSLSTLHQRSAGLDTVYAPALRDHRRLRDYPPLPAEGRTDALSRRLMQQHSGGLVNLLHYGDALSMAHGIESRMPFLDHRLVEFAWRLPSDFKVRHGVGKALHRDAMRGVVPDYVLDQKVKLGFTTPIAQQFKDSARGAAGPLDVLFDERCLRRGLFERQGLRRIVDDHRQGRHDHGNLLYRLLSVELWFRRFIDDATAAARPELLACTA